jgi:CRISPR/Cas system endoribonuclease Cas6 (RAMP superfamily)
MKKKEHTNEKKGIYKFAGIFFYEEEEDLFVAKYMRMYGQDVEAAIAKNWTSPEVRSKNVFEPLTLFTAFTGKFKTLYDKMWQNDAHFARFCRLIAQKQKN